MISISVKKDCSGIVRRFWRTKDMSNDKLHKLNRLREYRRRLKTAQKNIFFGGVHFFSTFSAGAAVRTMNSSINFDFSFTTTMRYQCENERYSLLRRNGKIFLIKLNLYKQTKNKTCTSHPRCDDHMRRMDSSRQGRLSGINFLYHSHFRTLVPTQALCQ